MKWLIKDKETVVKTCFALFPKRIGDYYVWLSRYYKTWDCCRHGGLYGNAYFPHWFVNKEDALNYVKKKLKGRADE